MPFTPAHPAIVLPWIRKRYCSATALIAGSISPDFEYFFKAKVEAVYSHTLLGVLYFDLPTALFISLIFHQLIKQSLISNLPIPLQKRLSSLKRLDFVSYLKRHFWIFMASALMGAVSHILWDSFTHNGRFFVQQFEFLRRGYFELNGAKYPLWYMLQHLSTFVGLSLIFVYMSFVPVDSKADVTKPRLSYWIVLFFFAMIFFALRFAIAPDHLNYGNAVVTTISSLLLSCCLVSTLPNFKTVKLA